jgi:hypothetical protein
VTDESSPARGRDFRFVDALRDLVRAPALSTVVIALALALVCAPLVLSTLAAAHRIQAAPDGRTAFKLYQAWFVTAVVLGAITSRIATALIASAMIERRDQPSMRAGEAIARTLAHGIPALTAALLAFALVGLGVVGAVVAWLPLAWLSFVAVPAAAAEQLDPGAAVRRSAALTRPAWRPLLAWLAATVVVEAAPFVYGRLTLLRVPKPPVAPVVRVMQIHGAILIAIVIASAVVPVVVYRRLRDRG